MPINKDRLEKQTGTKFYIFGTSAKDGVKAEWVEVRTLSGKDVTEISEATEKHVAEIHQPRKENGKIDKRATLHRIEYDKWIDDKKSPEIAKRMRMERSVPNWQILEEKDDGTFVPFPYNIDNLIYLMDTSEEFIKAYIDAIEYLTEERRAVVMDEKKTSETSLKPSKRKPSASESA